MKISKNPADLMIPFPVTLVTCRDSKGTDNIMTTAWIGILTPKPPMIGICMHESRYSTPIIEESGEFVVNFPGVDKLEESDYCGSVSGKNVDKFSKSGFTKEPAKKVKASLIKECPISLECVVRERIGWGSYQVFIGEIVEAHVEGSVLNEKGNIDLSKVAPILFNVDEYWSRGMMKGFYGCGANKF